MRRPFRYSDAPNSYHHWAIIGDETWSDATDNTLSLAGDIVVFPGAELTIEPGTVIEFESKKDRHQFSPEWLDEPGRNDLAEIFVYGTLTAEGESGKSIVFQRTGRTSTSAPDGGLGRHPEDGRGHG